MAIKYSNNAITTITSAIGTGDTTITVADGSVFPTLDTTAGDVCYMTLYNAANTINEIVLCTVISSNTLTVTRAYENTTALSWGAGSYIAGRLTAGMFTAMYNQLASQGVPMDVRNDTVSAFAAGQPVYMTGYNSGHDRVTIDLADSDDAAKMPAIGLLKEGLAAGKNGELMVAGVLTDVDTTGTGSSETWAVGQSLYVSTTAGKLTNVRPTGQTEKVQSIAKVMRVHATTGVLLIQGAGRTNDIPNDIAIADIVNLQANLNLKANVSHNHNSDYAALNHTHAEYDPIPMAIAL